VCRERRADGGALHEQVGEAVGEVLAKLGHQRDTNGPEFRGVGEGDVDREQIQPLLQDFVDPIVRREIDELLDGAQRIEPREGRRYRFVLCERPSNAPLVLRHPPPKIFVVQ
jgi:hypothetical protein